MMRAIERTGYASTRNLTGTGNRNKEILAKNASGRVNRCGTDHSHAGITRRSRVEVGRKITAKKIAGAKGGPGQMIE